MLRHAIVLLPLAVGLAACNTTYYAPGAAGRVVDADTGKPLRGASVTREAIGRASFAPGPDGRIDYQSVLVPAEGVPAEKVVTDQSGRFEIRPAGRTQIAFLYSHNASGLDCKVLVTADGYETNEVSGLASAKTFWRADFGKILLKKR